MKTRYRLLVGLMSSMALPLFASAQNPQPAPPQVTHTPTAPPSASTPPPEKIAPPDHSATMGNTTLSDRLSEQQGTLKPPTTVDPGIQAPIPHRGESTMPVIPPPGTAGGNQQVVPK